MRIPDPGIRGASTVDLVALLIGETITDADERNQIARRILRHAGSLQNFGETSIGQLEAQLVVKREIAVKIAAAMELGRKSAIAGRGEIEILDNDQAVATTLAYLRREKREHFVALLLDTKCGLIRIATIHIGTIDRSVVGFREVFREAIRDGAAQIIVAHNHPSGDPEPSVEDIEITHDLVEIGQKLDIPVLDHIIIGDPKHFSFRSKRMI